MKNLNGSCMTSCRMLTIADMNEVYADHAKPGGWNGQYIYTTGF